jgi:hypothetical protein
MSLCVLILFQKKEFTCSSCFWEAVKLGDVRVLSDVLTKEFHVPPCTDTTHQDEDEE